MKNQLAGIICRDSTIKNDPPVTMLNTRQTLLVKLSWSYFSNRLEEFGDTFYRILFDMEPALRPMFLNDMEVQRRKFSAMMNHIVWQLTNPNQVKGDIRRLGSRHIDYGVRPEHYDTLMIAFLLTMERKLKSKWDNETKEAWTMALVYIMSEMKKAYRKSPVAAAP
jgi:hemoglobin-like flavoprotein